MSMETLAVGTRVRHTDPRERGVEGVVVKGDGKPPEGGVYVCWDTYPGEARPQQGDRWGLPYRLGVLQPIAPAETTPATDAPATPPQADAHGAKETQHG